MNECKSKDADEESEKGTSILWQVKNQDYTGCMLYICYILTYLYEFINVVKEFVTHMTIYGWSSIRY